MGSVVSGVVRGQTGTGTGAAAPATTTWDYDTRDRVTADGTDGFGYDAASNLIETPDGGLGVFDPAQRLCWISTTATGGDCASPPGDATTFDYDSRGNRTAMTYPSGTQASYGYDAENRMTTAVVPAVNAGQSAQLETVPIARIVDTTTATGTCNAGTCAQFDADVPVAVTVAGAGGVPGTGAVAVVGTITVTDPDGDGWLNVNPNGDAAAAVIALRDGATAATGFTAQLDTNGDINLIATADVDVAVDITGYYRAPDPWVPALNYWPTDAVLAADTTTGTGTCDGTTCATLAAGDHDVLVAGVGTIPATDVAAVTVSILGQTTGAAGTLRAAPNGDASAGSLAWDTVFPNAAGQFTVPVNGDGTITVEVDTATDIRVSVTGWWATPESATDTGTGLVLVDDGPVRLVDTAENIGTCDGDPCATLVGNDPPVQVAVADEIDLEDIVAVMVSVTVHDPIGPGLVGLGANATDLSALMVFDDTAHTAAIIPVDPETGTISMASWTNVDVTIDVIGGFTRPTTTYRYEYDSAGLRTAKEREGTGGWRDEFTWTAHGGLPLLLAEHRGTDTSYLVYGPGGTPIYQVTKTGSVMYFHQDHQGSTRLVTNANGTVRGTLDYNTYGQITANTVPWLYEQPLATYTGEYTDTETGFIYLRARHYDPATGQFTTRDPIVAITEEPYGYTGGNPANYTDPWGLCKVGPVKVGFLTRDDGGCKGSHVVDGVKDYADDASAYSGGVAAGCLLFAWTGVGAACAGAAGIVSISSSAMHSVAVCLDDGFTSACRWSLAQTGLAAVSMGIARAYSRLAQSFGRIFGSVLRFYGGIIEFTGSFSNLILSLELGGFLEEPADC